MDIILSAIAHRTGSTLVQRIFNKRAGTLIWGEHGGIVSQFVRIRALAEHFAVHGKAEKKAYFGSGENANTWIANMSPEPERIGEGVVQAVRAFFAAAYAEYRESHDRIGFKEVRYGKPEIELLKSCYPAATIVLLVRHPVDVWRSAAEFWSGDADLFARIWNERAIAYAKLRDPERGTHLVRYEDIVARDENTISLLSELAEIPRPEIEKVLGVRLNSTRTERSEEDVDRIRSVCQDGLTRLGYGE
ncbi:sulfotransferase [Cohnella zeiphila]|uniref:Sulfotransferase n=1 Tax=Cohnella zeiphila TaxID=2761120 RepID=A0A7X0SQN9_9BACL|nr:sulfotransferase [Cohnella zeiphila]MBB6734368.1 sulfotransferase [Cohnella zeiphila]